MHLYERPDHDFLWDGRLWQKRPSQQIAPVHDGAGQSTERQMMRMQHAYRVDECLLVCGQPSATWAELGSPRDKKIAMSHGTKAAVAPACLGRSSSAAAGSRAEHGPREGQQELVATAKPGTDGGDCDHLRRTQQAKRNSPIR